MTPEERKQCIIERLQALSPLTLDVTDDSHLHQGHPGARSGASHFSVNITSLQFDGLSLIEKHRLIYSLLGDLIPQEIHALKIKAQSTEK